MKPRGVVRKSSSTVVLSWLVLGAACTPVSEPAQVQLQLSIDADDSVRKESLEVEARLEKQDPNGGSWVVTGTPRSFRPPSGADWPLWAEQQFKPQEFAGRYQLTATARDAQTAVVAQARVIAELGSSHTPPMLAVYLEASCLRRSELCGPNMTCHAGDCVSAVGAPGATHMREDAASAASGGAPSSDTPDASAPPPKLAQENSACTTPDATSCSEGSDPEPLACHDGSWQRQPPCRQEERCAPDSGECRAVAPECVGRAADEVFCDGDRMRVCSDLLSSMVRPCDAHEHCVADARGVRCGCDLGYVQDTAGCKEATECDMDYGGCDPLSTCRVEQGQVTCGDCPSGYTGHGKTGCQPLLTSLAVGGSGIPGFAPNSYDYRVKSSLLRPVTTIDAAGPDGTHVEVNTHPMLSASFETPVLALGENKFDVALVAKSGQRSTYHVVIEREGAERAYIKASNPDANDLLGTMVAISGDTIIAGAAGEDSASKQINGDESNNSAAQSGAVDVWVRSGSSWVKQAYLKAMDAAAGDIFGATLGISGDTIVVGAVRVDPVAGSYQHPGAAYVFVRKAGVWTQQARLSAHDGVAGDMFGHFVAVEGDTIVVGAPRIGGNSDSAGAVYVFTRSGEKWTEQPALVRADKPVNGSMFGSTTLLDHGTLLVAAEQEQRGAGAAYVFVRNADGTFVQQARLAPEAATDNEHFSASMAILGDTVAIGAPNSMQPLVVPAGSVYVFERSGESWSPVGVLHPSVPRSDDYFGSCVGVTSQAILVGASGDNSGGHGIGADPKRGDGILSGALYVFPRNPSGWTSPTYIKASNAEARDGFGFSFANSEDMLVVGAPFESSASPGVNANAADNNAVASGALYLFE